VFACATVRAAERSGVCADIAGSKNVVVIEDGRGARLALLDIGVHRLARKEETDPSGFAETRRRLAYLERLRDAVVRPGDLPAQAGGVAP